METEDLSRRAPPPRPYAPRASTLTVPKAALDATIALLQKAGRRESGLFWYGPRSGAGDGEVKLVVAPQQEMHWGNYHIPAEALAIIVRKLPDDWRPLAQIHSHPNAWVEHSRYDDRMVVARRALSLVFPNYGRYEPAAFPTGVGVHEFQEGYWHLLDIAVAARRVRLGDGSVEALDLR